MAFGKSYDFFKFLVHRTIEIVLWNTKKSTQFLQGMLPFTEYAIRFPKTAVNFEIDALGTTRILFLFNDCNHSSLPCCTFAGASIAPKTFIISYRHRRRTIPFEPSLGVIFGAALVAGGIVVIATSI